MRRREFSLTALLGAGLSVARCRKWGSSAAGQFFHKGVNFTAEWPDKYASHRTRTLLSGLPDYGVNSIALVPYGFSRKGSTEVRFDGRKVWENDASLEELTQLAHEKGMKVFLKPQLWVPRSFPGELEFGTREEAGIWFSGYAAFLEHYATLARRIEADLFCVGVEFSGLVRHEEEWRRLIQVARQCYSGPLVYAANWGSEFESVRFWDALDYIGLNNYYPLPDDFSAEGVAEIVERVHRQYQRPVIFPEAGFPSLEAPHRQPWDETPRRISLEDQARCYEAVLEAFYDQPWFQGVYWWKIGSNGAGGPGDGSHTPWGKPAMDVVARWYLHGDRS